MGCSTWDIDVPHGSRTNCHVRLAWAVEAEARSNLGPSGLRTNSPRQSLERLCFSRRGVFLRKRCTLPEIRLRPFILVPSTYGVLNHCPLSGHAVDQS
ncbi:hypothetical protein ACOMHN_012483 [Nucella lapillus]